MAVRSILIAVFVGDVGGVRSESGESCGLAVLGGVLGWVDARFASSPVGPLMTKFLTINRRGDVFFGSARWAAWALNRTSSHLGVLVVERGKVIWSRSRQSRQDLMPTQNRGYGCRKRSPQRAVSV